MKRRWFLLTAVAFFFAGLWFLDANLKDLVPSEGGRRMAGEFASAALRPALTFEDAGMRESGASFAGKIATALWLTIRYAVVAMSLALVIGLVGGVLGARSWWGRPSRALEVFRRFIRLLATAVRSVHELMWALLFISAVGTSPLAAVLALALPFGGTLAKVFSELLDEAHSSASEVMRATGGSGFAAFLGGVVMRALPDLVTYTLYRLECGIRSSAVLGFVGIPTIGFHIKTSFEDGHYREIWSYLYALLAVVIFFEWVGSRVRDAMSRGKASKKTLSAEASATELFQQRGKSHFLRATGFLVAVLAVAGWLFEPDWSSGLSQERRLENFQRFTQELIPYPVRAEGDWSTMGPWLKELLLWDGLQALWRTFHLGTSAALLAGAVALCGILWGARSLARKAPRGVPMAGGFGRMVLGKVVRGSAIVARSFPEFILAFLLLQVFGPTVWALIFALAIHNGGILLRLGAEVVDNASSRSAEVILLQGGSRSAAYLGALLPEGFNRQVLFLFYRWETCIREATMLGMLGVGSLGYLISEAKVRLYFDEMLVWVILGGLLVFLGDLTSDWVRKRLREGDGLPRNRSVAPYRRSVK
ncbi:ABC transporter permease subunit [Roseibacillus persicicus]|uniref:PhnE/PtxC family ABC transporter permease n=1 Tax=Roseibacillus persicicus TaxID=454148 RepID=UPI00398AE25C